MSLIVNKFLIAADKFMPETHLRSQDLHIVLVEDHSLKLKEWKTFKKTRDLRYIYQNKLDKSCFQHNMVYSDFKDLNRRTTADKVLHDKVFNIAKIPKYDGYHVDLLHWLIIFLSKKCWSS